MAVVNCYMLKLLHAKSMRVRLYASLPSHQAVCVYVCISLVDYLHTIASIHTYFCSKPRFVFRYISMYWLPLKLILNFYFTGRDSNGPSETPYSS